MALITLDAAKAHLYIPPAETRNDTAVQAVVDEASDIVVHYLKRPVEDPPWDATTAPPRVQAVVKAWVGHLWTRRDDQTDFDKVWTLMHHLLAGDRDPAVV